MKGIFNSNPPKPRYSATWRVQTVTAFLTNLGPNGDLNIRLLSYKLSILLSLVCASRAGDLCLISVDGIRKSLTGWELVLSGLRKTSRPSKAWPTLFVPYFPQDSTLCPVHCLEAYLSRTAPYREGISQVFLTTQKPFKPAARDTVANWMKRTLSLAGIDTSVFKAHSTRGASTSKAKEAGVSLADILRVADWSSDTTFNKFYYREAHHRAAFGVAVLAPTKL